MTKVTRLRTSVSHPLYIDSIGVPNAGGLIGMTFCPGKRGDSMFGDFWARDLKLDMQVIREWGASAVVTLIEDHEFDRTIAIETLGVGTTEFDLSEERAMALYESGRDAAQRFLIRHWDREELKRT